MDGWGASEWKAGRYALDGGREMALRRAHADRWIEWKTERIMGCHQEKGGRRNIGLTKDLPHNPNT